MVVFSSETHFSAKAPPLLIVITWSPGLNLSTPSPTASIIPDASLPGINGGSVLTWYFPSMDNTSGKFIPAALTLINICPFEGLGSSRSSRMS